VLRRSFICGNDRYNLYDRISSKLIIYCIRHLKWVILGSIVLSLNTFITTPRRIRRKNIYEDCSNNFRFRRRIFESLSQIFLQVRREGHTLVAFLRFVSSKYWLSRLGYELLTSQFLSRIGAVYLRIAFYNIKYSTSRVTFVPKCHMRITNWKGCSCEIIMWKAGRRFRHKFQDAVAPNILYIYMYKTIDIIVNTLRQTGLLVDKKERNEILECSLKRNRMKSILRLNLPSKIAPSAGDQALRCNA
jgi:hypothetical protein